MKSPLDCVFYGSLFNAFIGGIIFFVDIDRRVIYIIISFILLILVKINLTYKFRTLFIFTSETKRIKRNVKSALKHTYPFLL